MRTTLSLDDVLLTEAQLLAATPAPTGRRTVDEGQASVRGRLSARGRFSTGLSSCVA